jgi:uncharacterized protein (TIGR02996 family)
MLTAKHRALLDAILAAPDDDELRLVYADLLEEEGEAIRAAFLRAQLARSDAAEALETRYGAQLAGVVASYARRWTFARGLVAAISADLPTLGAHLATLLAAAPIRTLQLADDDEPDDDAWEARRLDAARAIAACPRLAAIETLDATFGCFEPAPLAAVLASPHLTGLHRLVLGRDTGRPAIRALAAARLPALRALCCFPEAATLDAAELAPLVARLDVLELWGTGLGPDGAEALFGTRAPLRLRHLALAATAYRANPIGPRGAAALAAAPLDHLRTLELGGAALGDAGLAALLGAPWFARLEVLDLDENQLTDRGLRALLAAAGGLTQLSIGRNQVSAETLAAFERLPRLTRLRFAGPWRALLTRTPSGP